MAGTVHAKTLADQLKQLGVRGVLVKMAEHGQLLELRCEMPRCYCPNGDRYFEPKPTSGPMTKWSPNADHYPRLKMDCGKLEPSNVRLAHVYCNNMDYGWRTRIRAMLERDPPRSMEEIAEALNKKKNALVPPGAKAWTAKLVRKAYTS